MIDWELEIGFHWPHDRLAIGWEVLYPDEKFDYTSYVLFLGFITITLDIN